MEKEMEKETKMDVTSMTMLDNEESNVKALATVALNNEFVIKGVKVIAGENGLFVGMPSRSFNGEYTDIAFPITAEAREQLNNTVLDSFTELANSGEKTLFNPVDISEKSNSDISVSIHKTENAGHTKAAGQIVIDDNFVITGVKVVEGKGKNFVQMPSYQTQTGEYAEYANAISTAMHEKLNSKVIGAYENLPTYKGVRFAELGDKENIAQFANQNNKFAEKLMTELDNAGVAYHARIADKTTISVKSEDKEKVNGISKQLTSTLKAEREDKADKKPSLSENLSKAKKEADRQNAHKPNEQPNKQKGMDR